MPGPGEGNKSLQDEELCGWAVAVVTQQCECAESRRTAHSEMVTVANAMYTLPNNLKINIKNRSET